MTDPTPPAARAADAAPTAGAAPLRIANCSGFYGDRFAAAREMVEGGPIDVLTGDWLAELTMLILAKDRERRPEGGFARTFVRQMEEVLAACAERGIKVVANAGGLNPAGCADAVRAIADAQGLSLRVAHVEGDDLLGRLDELRAAGHRFVNADTGEDLDELGVEPITANAYLGGWAIAEALGRGADVVITGRVTDAAVVVGPAAWRFGWERTDWDELAGAVVAGHIIECGAQCTGGNYAFFTEVPGLEHPGFPIAEVHADGSSVITKHPGTGGQVSVGTVTAQLLYEIQGTDYANPDATVRLNSIRLSELSDQGPDRVLVHSVRGLPGPEQVKVAVNSVGGWRNTMTFVLTGLDIEAKADLAERTLWSLVPGGREAFDHVDVQLVRHDTENPPTNEDALARLHITVTDADRERVGRAFSGTVIEMLLASYPGLFTTSPPGDATSFGIYWPVLLPASVPHCEVVLEGGERVAVSAPPTEPPPLERRASAARGGAGGGGEGEDAAEDAPAPRVKQAPATAAGHPETLSSVIDDLAGHRMGSNEAWEDVPTRDGPLGLLVGARSGDKGGNANVGVWARSDEAFDWLAWYLTVDRLRALLPAETEGLVVERYVLANLRAVNFVIVGLLGRGVAATTRTDPQAKGLGEYLRAKHTPLPLALL